MIPTTRFERRKADTKKKIFEAAMELFREQGFDGTTMEQIAEKADVSKGTLFNRFENKKAILSYFGEQRAEAVREALGSGLREVQGAKDKLAAIFGLMAEMNEKDKAYGLLLKQEMLQRYAEGGRENFNWIKSVILSFIEQGIREGEFRSDLIPSEAVSLLGAIYVNSTIEWVREGDERSLEQAYRTQLDLVFRGMDASRT